MVLYTIPDNSLDNEVKFFTKEPAHKVCGVILLKLPLDGLRMKIHNIKNI